MNCLIIVEDVGLTAPGIVYETIIRELAKDMKITLITVRSRDNVNLPVTILPSVRINYKHYRISNLFMSIIGRPCLDDLWVIRQKSLIDSEIIKQQNIIISFISFQGYKSLILGYYLSNKFSKKWAIYSVDAIPAPAGWSKINRLYKKTQKFVSKYISLCDVFFSANSQMLEYQLSFLHVVKKHVGVMFTPIRRICMVRNKFVVNTTKNFVFLYTGDIYGPRKIDALLCGFRLFLKDYPYAQLLFVGVNNKHLFDQYIDLMNSNNLCVYDYTSDLETFYEKADVLIDINAYFDNDVFLSSKIVNYLPLMKPIISITGLNSPARNIFVNDPSIIHCRHDFKEIYDAFCKITNMTEIDYWKRQSYIDLFSVKNAVIDFKNALLAVSVDK